MDACVVFEIVFEVWWAKEDCRLVTLVDVEAVEAAAFCIEAPRTLKADSRDPKKGWFVVGIVGMQYQRASEDGGNVNLVDPTSYAG